MKLSIIKHLSKIACLIVGLSILPQISMADSVMVTAAETSVIIDSNGSQYNVKAYDSLDADVFVQLHAGNNKKIKSYETWLLMAVKDFPNPQWQEYKTLGYKKTYPFNERPNSVVETVGLQVPGLTVGAYAVQACNQLADTLRAQGLNNSAIFAIDRTITLGVDANFGFEVTGSGLQQATLPVVWSDKTKEVIIKCGKSASGAKNMTTLTTVDGAWLTLVEKTSYSGTCKLDLNGNFKTSIPGVEVTFRYHDDKGNMSDLKTETTGDDKFAFFTHTYDVSNNPNGAETGSIRIVGVSHQFESLPWNYNMNCSNVNSQIDVIQPPEVKVVLAQLEDYVTLSGDRNCPSKARFVGSISGNGHQFYGRAIIQIKQGQQSKYSTDYLANVPGNSWKIFGGYVADLDWSSSSTNSAATYSPTNSTGPTSKTIYARVKVYDKSMNLIQPITNLQPVEVTCTQGPQMMGIPLSNQAKTSNTAQVKQMGVEKKQKKTIGKTTAPTTAPGAAIKTSAKADLIATTPGLIFAGGIRAWGSTVTLNNNLNQVNKGLGPQKNLCRFTQTAFRPSNKGNVATGLFTTKVYRNNQQAHSVNFLLQANSGIPTGDGWYKFNLLLAQGMNTVKVKLDTANSVSESNESNNIYTVKVNVKFSCRKPNIGGSSSVIKGKTTSQPARSVPGQIKIKCKAGQVAVKKSGKWQCKQATKR